VLSREPRTAGDGVDLAERVTALPQRN